MVLEAYNFKMFHISALTVLVLIFPALTSGIDLTKEYEHSAFVDPPEKYQLHWTVLRDTKQIKFAVQVLISHKDGLALVFQKDLVGK